jgi:hypothetical protein
MRLACVAWLTQEGYSREEIARFLGLGRNVVDALADVDELDLRVVLGPKAKLARAHGLI